ncbi:MAG: 30S ribosome-binding factor RbfA [Chitinophagaceae bacterium]|jgi:ribosome-binding factor A|nr:30S ribosome-binding factor RbfA [Chitinophagaceae bacterium]
MEDSKRQRQVAGLIQEELNFIFRHLGLNMIDGGMVSISSVKVTPDLLEARIYLSFFQVADAAASLKTIEGRAWEIKKELAEKIKHQLRRIPALKFFTDDTMEHAYKVQELLNQIKEEGNKES